MILQVYVAFNSFLECSGQPVFDDHEPDVFAKSFERRLLTSEDEKVFTFENVIWYHLGSYDDESMIFKANNSAVRILDCNQALDKRKIKAKLLEAAREKEKKEDV